MDEREARRSDYPLTIPDALLGSDAMGQACAERDFQEIFRLVNRRTGRSYADMAAAIGKMTSSRISDVIRGVRGIRGREVIERVADGFGIPGEMLGVGPRSWQGDAPSTERAPMPSPRSLSRSASEHPDVAAVDSFRMADRRLGGGHLYASVIHYLTHQVGPRLFGVGNPENSRQTFQAAAALTEMAAWMAHDSGHDTRARQHFDHALPLAQAGLDSALSAHVMAGMSHLALQTNRSEEAMALARSGQESAKSGPVLPTLSAKLYAMEARALARLGEEAASRHAIAAAADFLTRTPDEEPSVWVSSFDAASLASEKALCLEDLGRLPAAAQEARNAVSLRAADRARSRVFGQISLATIHAKAEALEEACEVGFELLESCRTLGSMRITRQLDELARTLQPHRTDRPVADFLACLGEANRQRGYLLAGLNMPQPGGA